MIIVKNAADLENMRVSGRIAANVLERVVRSVSPGMTTGELGELADGLMREYGAESAFMGYRGYPGVICVSVNEEVVHGIPGNRRICLGDLVSIDVGVEYNGYMGDNAKTVMVGVTDPMALKLVKITEQALAAGIGAAVAGNRLGDVSNAIQTVVEAAGFSVVRDFVGHGIGRSLHEDPQVPNFGARGRGPVLKAGMTLCLEPMVSAGGFEVKRLGDGWTVVTKDMKPSAHFEHMIAVGEKEAEILTVSDVSCV